MKRLRGLSSRIAAPSPRVAGMAKAGSGFARTDGLTRQQRGYGADWERVRARVLADEPLCRLCRTARATEVDHIRPFQGLADPLRLARPNLRPVCAPCHRARTARQARGVGGV